MGLAVNASTTCWFLASDKRKSNVDTFYKCGFGNLRCTKVLDPALEKEAKLNHANTLVLVGAILLGVGLLLFAALGMGVKMGRDADKAPVKTSPAEVKFIEPGDMKITKVGPPVV